MVGGHQVHLLLGHRGRSHRRGRGSKRKCTLPPPTFPDSHFSFEAPPSIVVHHPGPTFGLRLPASAYRYFSLFFDDQLLEHIANQMNLYAKLHLFHWDNYEWFDTNVDELRSFLGMFIATGLVPLANLGDYWRTKSIFSQPGITKEMSRN